MIRIQRPEHQSLGVQVTKSIEHRIQNLARFLSIERPLPERVGKRIVGRFEHPVENHFAAVSGTPALEEFD